MYWKHLLINEYRHTSLRFSVHPLSHQLSSLLYLAHHRILECQLWLLFLLKYFQYASGSISLSQIYKDIYLNLPVFSQFPSWAQVALVTRSTPPPTIKHPLPSLSFEIIINSKSFYLLRRKSINIMVMILMAIRFKSTLWLFGLPSKTFPRVDFPTPVLPRITILGLAYFDSFGTKYNTEVKDLLQFEQT